MNLVALAFVLVPLLSFAAAGMFEFQRDRQSLRSPIRGLPLALAAVLAVLLLVDAYYPYFSVRGLSKTMAAVSLIVPVSAVVCRYRSRLTAGLIFTGGLVLAFFWLLNRFVA